jgi:indole-3-glycerol phosphate synthase
MPRFLDEIIAAKKEEVRTLRARKLQAPGRSSAKRDFVKALVKCEGLAVIAEVKKASPSKGIIASSFNPVAIAKTYEKGQAAAVSVLTDEKYFQGALSYLEDVRSAISLPVLRKDFIIDPVQVIQSACANADAMLLIAAILDQNQMQELYCAAIELSIDPLLEVHSMKECERVLKLSPTPQMIGINNRDLQTFETSLSTTLSIVGNIPREIVVISESGISTQEHTSALFKAGVRGVLIGESLMRADDPAVLIKTLTSSSVDRHTPFSPLRVEMGKEGSQGGK